MVYLQSTSPQCFRESFKGSILFLCSDSSKWGYSPTSNWQDLLTLDCWIDYATLVSPNTEEDIIKKGFTFLETEGGMKVNHGALPKSTIKESSRSVKQSKKILACKVAVGRALATPNASAAQQENLPDNYNSFYLTETSRPDDYMHEYFIKSSAQVTHLK